MTEMPEVGPIVVEAPAGVVEVVERRERPERVTAALDGYQPVRLRLINAGTDDECWQVNEVDHVAVMAAAEAGEAGFSMAGNVATYDGLEISWHAGS